MFKKTSSSYLFSLFVASAANAVSPVGWIDTVNQGGDSAFRGWVCDTTSPYTPQKVLIYRDGKYAGRTVTGTYRPDVANAGYCSGNAYTGWSFAIPNEEFTGNLSSWTATLETAANAEITHPPFSGYSVTATLPKVSTISYIAPVYYGYWDAVANTGMGTTPGSKLDELASFWDFSTRIANIVPFDPVTTYDAGIYTGTYTGSSVYQRGDNRTSGGANPQAADIAEGRSVMQRKGYTAGMMTNSYWLDAPGGGPLAIWGGGQHGTVWSFKDDRKLNISQQVRNDIAAFQSGRINNTPNTRRPFVGGVSSSLVLEGDVQIPARYIAPEYANTSSGQVNYYLYFWDTSSGQQIAIVMSLWDTRPVSVTGCTPQISFDGNSIFAGTSVCTAATQNNSFATFDPSGGAIQPLGAVFSAPLHYKVSFSGQNLLNVIQSTSGGFSQNLKDYVLTSALFGTEQVGRMSLGASITNFSVYLNR